MEMMKMPIDDNVKDVKAPQGKFAVCLWDGYPRFEPPMPNIVDTVDTEEEANKYSAQKNAELQRDFYRRGGEKLTPELVLVYLMDGRSRMIEPEYFVMNDKGMRLD
jgi:hypothetical protein